MGMSTRTFLEMDDGSTSMWMILAWGQKCSILPVTRSSKRAPMAISTSVSCIAMLAS